MHHKNGGETKTIATCSHPWAIAVDATRVYFTFVGDGTIRSAPE